MKRRLHRILNTVKDNSRSNGENVKDLEKLPQTDYAILEYTDVSPNESFDSNSITDSQHGLSLCLLDDECLKRKPNVIVQESDYV